MRSIHARAIDDATNVTWMMAVVECDVIVSVVESITTETDPASFTVVSSPRLRRLIFMAVIVVALPNPASAQIISTMFPGDSPQAGSRIAAVHLMAGYASWEYGTDGFDEIAIGLRNGTIEGKARSGFIIAADLPLRISRNVHVTVGGWHNSGGARTVHDPEHQYHGLAGEINVYVPDRVIRERSRFSSVYGSVSYKSVGIQAGIVPVRIEQTLDTPSRSTSVSNRQQMDFSVFGVGRYTEAEAFVVPVTLTVGIGAYRYSARAASLFENGFFEEGTASPASTAASFFFNMSASLTRHVAFDFSVWATGANRARLGDTQSRVTLGLGVAF